ncbi:cyclophilin-like fold protein [Streptomyces sp. NPDC091268]|uniref:cyclophilin-like fold protein n=1 Tax=Streptomyces sp. NPDC091268 TaxID=3365979 RepID=UPI0037F7EC13
MNCAVRRQLVRVAPAAALLLAVTACSGPAKEATPAATSSASPSPGQQETQASAPSSASEGSTAMGIRVALDGRPVEATLNDSPPARDFAALLPLTLDLKDFHGTERVADLPCKLDTSRAPEPAEAKAGDIAYYAPWGNLALFYRDGPAPSSDLLILGHLDVSADELRRATRVTVASASRPLT